ncbi:MAG: hypothetical protein J6R42_03085, partial [Clostridia bacterium]|nr:hypothetical protein [Clostridia bacterium]
MRYLTKFLCQFISFFLVFAIGFLSCIAVVVGAAAYAYCNVSIDKLNEFGMGISTDQYFDPEADVPVNSLTLDKLLGEILGIAGTPSEYSLQELIDRYGLKLDEGLIKYLPSEAVMTTALDKLFSSEGIDIFLQSTKVKYVFDLGLIPEGILSDEVYATIGEKTLYEIIFPSDDDYSSALRGVQLGFFLGVDYFLDENGNYVVDQAGEFPTFKELIAPIDIGAILGIVTGGVPVMNALQTSLGHIYIEDVIATITQKDPEEVLGSYYLAIENRSLGDLFKDDGTGIYELYIPGLFEDFYLGMLFGLEAYIDYDGQYVVVQKGEKPSIIELLAPINLGAIMEATFEKGDPLGAAYKTIGDIAINDLLGAFMDVEKAGISTAFDDKSIKDLLPYDYENKKFEKPQVAEFFEGVYLGDFMGVEYDIIDGEFVIRESDDSHALVQLIAHVNLGEIIAAIFTKEISQVLVALYDQLAPIVLLDAIHVFVPDTSKINGLDESLADKSIGTFLKYGDKDNDGASEFYLDAPALFDNIYLAYFFDGVEYTIDAEGNLTVIGAIDTWQELIAHVDLHKFADAIFNKKDIMLAIYETFGSIRIDDILDVASKDREGNYDYLLSSDYVKLGDFISYDEETEKWSLKPLEEYASQVDYHRLIADLKEDPNLFVVALLALGSVAYLAYMLFLSDKPAVDTMQEQLAGKTAEDVVSILLDTVELRLDRLLGTIDFDEAFVFDEESGSYEFSWYGAVKDIKFDDVIYAIVDYEEKGYADFFGGATLSSILVEDGDGYRLEAQGLFEYILLDSFLNNIFIIAESSLEEAGLGGIFDGVKLSDVIELEDGELIIHPSVILLNLEDAEAELRAIKDDPFALRSIVLLGGFLGSVAYKYFKEYESFSQIEFDTYLQSLNIYGEIYHEIFSGKTVGELLPKELSDLPASLFNFFSDVRLTTFAQLLKIDAVNEGELQGIFDDVTLGELIELEDGKLILHPSVILFNLEDPKAELRAIKEDPFALRSLVLLVGFIGSSAYKYFEEYESFSQIEFDTYLEKLGITGEAYHEIFGGKTVGDLLPEELSDLPASVVTFFSNVRLSTFASLLKVATSNEELQAILSDIRFGDIFFLDEEGKVDMSLIDAVENISIYHLVDALHDVDDNEDLKNILVALKTVGDLVYVDLETDSYYITAVPFLADVAFADIFGLLGMEDTMNPIFKDKTIGDVVFYDENDELTVAWLAFLETVYFSDIFDALEVENQKLYDLFEGRHLGQFFSYDENDELQVEFLPFVAGFEVVDIVSTFVDEVPEGLIRLLDEKTLGTLLTDENGDFSLQLADFFGDMEIRDFVSLVVDNQDVYELIGATTIGDIYDFESKEFHPFALTDNIALGGIFDLIGMSSDSAVYELLGEKTIGDIITM